MKTIRILSLGLLVITTFVSIDLLINLMGSFIPSMNDGIGVHSILGGNLYFGDHSWSQERFFDAFVIGTLVNFGVFVENIVLAMIAMAKKK